MTKAICIALVLLSTTCAHADFKQIASYVHKDICEASAAVALPDGPGGKRFIVANDEDNILRAYSATASGDAIPIKGGDEIDKYLNVKAGKKADFEGATTLNGKIYWIGSHSRNSDGEERKPRWQFFSTTITTNGEKIELSASPSSHALLKKISALDTILADAIKLDDEESKDLAPDEKGFNIEGLTARADGKSMFIGLRNPLSGNNEAFVIPFQNPEAVAKREEKPRLGKPILINLEGRGIRSMEYSAAANTYFIIAGPNQNSGLFELYRWSGDAGQAPVRVGGSMVEFGKIPDFQPEAMFIDASGKTLHILSDDGDRMIGNKKCSKSAEKSFRSFVFTID
jgi:hypothetical protein